MAIAFDAAVEPDDLTVFVRQVPVTPGRRLTSMFPTEYVDDNKVDILEITHTNRTAKFRAWDGRLHVSNRDTVLEKSVKLPPLSSSYSVGELERLQMEFARTQGTREQAIVNAIYNDAKNGTDEVLNRMEMALGDVLTDFKFTLAGEGGLFLEADFGAPAGHTVTAAASWAIAGSSHLTELITWHDVYVATNGAPAGGILTSLTQIRNLTKSTQIINAVKGSAAGVTMVTIPELQAVLAANGLPPLLDPIDTSLDVDGVTTRVIAADKLMFVPANMGELGAIVYGVTATALELMSSPESSMSFEEAPGIVGVVIKEGPPFRQFTFVDACGMPVIRDPKKLLVADVVP